ncbi:MAG: polyamine ABC transporter ATP-binding protein [Candidatus Dactylopiibacterium carminicum]|uniref:Polyamine ABC transporter ATP-binding protein n=2 Tax=Candidatus Dactylopiibacterium carminicum TaxID=857335 RepID=A0A272ER70_9RHOO|nr:polyamine ABC transporter ATP-binding protein [Candidatus Dactylopiibacterium carminicum]PAS92629.1 MAG: polyamine ABC transporter ATP-binding protein [Candidatus Dactylopiibacterium carminicum]PAS96119.1 MAG: polyamine ABC transporter ATP-binding protein [Candidatus Dactylopiibacterium carminicum]
MAYDGRVIQQDLDFDIPRGQIFVIMGGSGCGKSTLLRHLIGLQQPAAGRILYGGDEDYWAADETRQDALKRGSGVLFQGGALWSSLTLAENIALPLEEFTDLPAAAIREIVAVKLALVGLSGFENHYPAEISGGMKKRAGLARAMALNPDILFCDEPSAGLDPLSARRLDELLLELRASLGSTIVLVTHELASIFAVADQAIFLDAESRTMTASGNPHHLAQHGSALVRHFLARGEDA